MPFEIFQSDKNQKYYFRLKAGNGEIILQSEAHDTKAEVEQDIQWVIDHAEHDNNYGYSRSKDGQHYFFLIASNKNIIGHSETYKQEAGMRNGVDSVRRNAVEGVEIKDLTTA